MTSNSIELMTNPYQRVNPDASVPRCIHDVIAKEHTKVMSPGGEESPLTKIRRGRKRRTNGYIGLEICCAHQGTQS